MSLQRINPQVLSAINAVNLEITILINLMQKRPLDREESTRLATAEQKMKYHATHHETEFAAFRQHLEEMRQQNALTQMRGQLQNPS